MPGPYRLKAKPPPDDLAPHRKTGMGALRRSVSLDVASVTKDILMSFIAPAFIVASIAFGAGAKIAMLALPVALAGSWVANRPLWGALFRGVDLHQGGLMYGSWRARGSVLFDDVDEVWLDVPTENAQIFGALGLTLKEHNGTRHSISLSWMVFEDARFILAEVLAACSDVLLPDAKAALAAGHSLQFGPASLDMQGLEVTTPSSGATTVRKMLWSEMTRAELVEGRLQFFSAQQDPIVLRVRDVPHPTLLRTLLRSLAPWQE